MTRRSTNFALFLIGTTAGAVLSALTMTASAHHGWTGYAEELASLSGSIAEASYSNPHASMTLKTSDKVWKIVLAPPSRMQTRGLTKEMLNPGEQVSVEGYPNKTDSNELRAERIVIAGKTIELR